ncbi:phage protein [Staphylococcus saprophyticus]|nr:phage protein [Staphylococcus saprophyticus]
MAHGEFGKWLEKVGLNKCQACRFIKVAVEQPKLSSGANLGLKALYQIATIPEEERDEKTRNIFWRNENTL